MATAWPTTAPAFTWCGFGLWDEPVTASLHTRIKNVRTGNGARGGGLAPEEDGGDGEDGGAHQHAHEQVDVAVCIYLCRCAVIRVNAGHACR